MRAISLAESVFSGETWIERLPFGTASPSRSLFLTLMVMVLAFGLRFILMPAIPTGSPFITFFPAVLLVSFLLGARLGAIAAVLSFALASAFFMTDPWSPGFMITTLPSTIAFTILVTLNLFIFHWMQQSNRRLRAERAHSAALAETRETLFRELQHRVSNNLQAVAGLLALQKKHVIDASAHAALDEAARRLAVIGRISRELYRPDGGARGVRELLGPLCADVADTSGKQVTVEIADRDGLYLAPDSVVPVALIVAEAVANAIEHGLGERESGRIDIACEGSGDAYSIEIRDDGAGLREGFDVTAHGGLGLHIAAMLATQLGATFEMVPGETGAIARLIRAPV